METDKSLAFPTPYLEKRKLIRNRVGFLKVTDMDNVYTHDTVYWIRSSNTNFTVKSAYNFLTYTPNIGTGIANIWKLKAPTRVMVFG